MTSSSLVSQILAPGGGVMLLPFVRLVIGGLLLLTSSAAVLGVARIHMVILSFLSAGTFQALLLKIVLALVASSGRVFVRFAAAHSLTHDSRHSARSQVSW
jgi:hypothetical protein